MDQDLPVSSIVQDVLAQFERISPSFRSSLNDALSYSHLKDGKNLKPNIQYHYSNGLAIKLIAQIDNLHKIHLYENFCQYLWCVTYSMVVQFDWLISDPEQRTITTEQYQRAIRTLNEAFSLTGSSWNYDNFYKLPNPTTSLPEEASYVELANEIFTWSITFILLHEFAHHFYGHVEASLIDDRKEEEQKADEYAIDVMLKETGEANKYHYELGIIFALIGMTMLTNDLRGGDEHPDNDDRLKIALAKMESDESWGFAAMALIIWNQMHNHKVQIPPVGGSYKALFLSTIDKISFNIAYKN